MPQLNFIQAINTALAEEMGRDPLTFLMGEDVVLGAFGATKGLIDKFGEKRVRNTPISEAGFVRSGGRRDGGNAADLRSRIRERLLLRVRPALQSGRQAPLHVRWAGLTADYLSRGVRRDGRCGRAALRNRLRAVPERPRTQARGALVHPT